MAVSKDWRFPFGLLILRCAILRYIRMGKNDSDIFREDGEVLAGLPGFCWRTCEMPSQLNRMELTSPASEFNLGKQII